RSQHTLLVRKCVGDKGVGGPGHRRGQVIHALVVVLDHVGGSRAKDVGDAAFQDVHAGVVIVVDAEVQAVAGWRRPIPVVHKHVEGQDDIRRAGRNGKSLVEDPPRHQGNSRVDGQILIRNRNKSTRGCTRRGQAASGSIGAGSVL